MNPEIKAKWVAALRSGKYKQGGGALLCEDRYCCLGVLAQIAADEKVIGPPQAAKSEQFSIFDGQISLLPKSVLEWAEFLDEETDGHPHWGWNIAADLGCGFLSFTELNDDEKLTFDQIADLIEYAL